jgi:hypothetical protein
MPEINVSPELRRKLERYDDPEKVIWEGVQSAERARELDR